MEEKKAVDKAERAIESIDKEFEERIYPSIIFVHASMTKYKELLKGVYMEGAVQGMYEIKKDLEDENETLRNKNTTH